MQPVSNVCKCRINCFIITHNSLHTPLSHKLPVAKVFNGSCSSCFACTVASSCDRRVSLTLVACMLYRQAAAKPAQSPRVLPPLPSSSNNPAVSRVRSPRSSESASESGVVSMSASSSADVSRKPAAVSESSDVDMSRVFSVILFFCRYFCEFFHVVILQQI